MGHGRESGGVSMVLNNYRERADGFLIPVARRLPGTNPHTISLFALVFAFLGGCLIYLGKDWLLPVASLLILLSSYSDALDGKVAKLHGKETRRGDFLDHSMDRYADLFILLGITFSAYCAPWIGTFAIVGVLMTSYMGTQAQALGMGRDYRGILGRSERQIILILAPLAQYVLIHLGQTRIWYFTVFEYVMLWFAIAGNFTALHRAVNAWRGLE